LLHCEKDFEEAATPGASVKEGDNQSRSRGGNIINTMGGGKRECTTWGECVINIQYNERGKKKEVGEKGIHNCLLTKLYEEGPR